MNNPNDSTRKETAKPERDLPSASGSGSAFYEWIEAHRKTALALAFVALCVLWPVGLLFDVMIDDTED